LEFGNDAGEERAGEKSTEPETFDTEGELHSHEFTAAESAALDAEVTLKGGMKCSLGEFKGGFTGDDMNRVETTGLKAFLLAFGKTTLPVVR
jgi:hypothetical protein